MQVNHSSGATGEVLGLAAIYCPQGEDGQSLIPIKPGYVRVEVRIVKAARHYRTGDRGIFWDIPEKQYARE
jgi:hypothetical protein